MPVSPTYPGVYIEDIPSSVRTLSGVDTSITAFVGQARRGPVNEPVRISQFSEFERIFGEIWSDCGLGYAVQQFFTNGGTDAVIVRVTRITGGLAARATRTFTVSPSGTNLQLEAADPGVWGNNVFITITHNTDGTFNLIVHERAGTLATDQILREEVHYNLSVLSTDSRFITGVLANASALVRVKGANPSAKPLAVTSARLLSGADGDFIEEADVLGAQVTKSGIYALEKADLFNLLSIPTLRRASGSIPATEVSVNTWVAALAYCKTRRAMLLVDPPDDWTTYQDAIDDVNDAATYGKLRDENAIIYFPRLVAPDPLIGNDLLPFVPSGAVAGVMARIDATRGVWKAPAGTDTKIEGVVDLTINLNDVASGQVNPQGINAIRQMPASGIVIWGARTLEGLDRLMSQWKFINVRRLALYIEESLRRGLIWAVFEPNDESLWAQIRLAVNGFLHDLHRQHAFASSSPAESYFVSCDASTTTQDDINKGIVNVVVGFAPTVPAEFVVLKIQQQAGQPTL